MSHESRLAICELCVNKTFSPKSGIICSITGERAAFETSCNDFTEDPIMVTKKRREVENRQNEIEAGSFGVEEESGGSPIKIAIQVVLFIASLTLTLMKCAS